MYIKKKFWLRFFCNEMNAKYVTWLFFQKNIWVYLGLNISLCSPFKCSITSYHMTIFFFKKIYSLLIFSFVIWKKKMYGNKTLTLFCVHIFSKLSWQRITNCKGWHHKWIKKNEFSFSHRRFVYVYNIKNYC